MAFYQEMGSQVRLLAPREDLRFYDSQSVELAAPITPLQAWGLIMARPSLVLKWAFWLRDAVSSKFGVKRIGGFSSVCPRSVSEGDILDFFRVEYASDQVLCLTERDRHLDVLTCVSVEGLTLTITSSVLTHNAFGCVYMWPVAPAHKLIVRSFLRRMAAR